MWFSKSCDPNNAVTVSSLTASNGGISNTIFNNNVIGCEFYYPAAVWLYGSGVIGMLGMARHRKA
jgi:hypothetical protein